MKKEIIILGIAILLIFIGLSGCFDSNKSSSELDKFVGTWKHGTSQGEETITFSSNGKCVYWYENAEWEIKNENLIIYLIGSNMTLTFDYIFLDDSERGKILELTNTETEQVDDYVKLNN